MSIFFLSLIIVLAHQLAWFLWSLYQQDNSWADIGWGTGFIAVALIGYYYHSGVLSLLLLVGTALWGVRLGWYLILRKQQQKGEDWRYKNWRKEWGSKVVLNSLLRVFLLQGLFMWIISLPIQLVAAFQLELSPAFAIIGGILFLFGLSYEAIADLQLYRFKRAPANKGNILHSGLWKYARHPNYFGEIVLWWGIYICTLWDPYALVGLLSPLCISWLLIRVSGVPMLERKQKTDPEFQRHMTDKPALIPNFFQTRTT